MRKINLSKPYIEDQALDSVVSVIKSGWLTQGEKVEEFETAIKNKLNVKYALAVNSATSALQAALLALGIAEGDEVIVPSFTWVATANVVELCGGIPIFVDIDLETFNALADQVIHKVTHKTKAIIVVHLFGKPFDVLNLKAKLLRNIPIIEDAACALGASINGEKCGAVGDIGVFSFHPRKSITTGEGGVIVTNNEHVYKHMSMLRNHGQDCTPVNNNAPWHMFYCPIVGFNFRMTDFQAALGIPQLVELDEIIEYRKKLVSLYQHKLSQCTLIGLPNEKENEKHAWQSYVVQVPLEIRNTVMSRLASLGVETRPGTHAVHMLSFYKNKYGFVSEDFPNTHNAFLCSISLPLHNHMTTDDVAYVSDNLLRIVHDSQ